MTNTFSLPEEIKKIKRNSKKVTQSPSPSPGNTLKREFSGEKSEVKSLSQKGEAKDDGRRNHLVVGIRTVWS